MGDWTIRRDYVAAILPNTIYQLILQGIIVLVPTYTVAYLTDKMVYTIPMLAAASFVAASINKQPVERKVDDVSKDLGKE